MEQPINLNCERTSELADIEEFIKLVAPLVEYLQTRHDKCNPYSWIIVRSNGVAFMSDSSWFPFKAQD